MVIAWFDSTDGTHKIDNLEGGLRDLGVKVEKNPSWSQAVAAKANIIWCEHLTRNAVEVSHHNQTSPVIVRVSAMELYKQKMALFNWDNIDCLLVQGWHLRKYFLERYKFKDADHVVVIPGAIDTNKFKLKTQDMNNKIAVVSEIHWRKGVQRIPDILEALPDKYTIHHIGKVVNWDCKNYLDYEIKRRGLIGRYSYIGSTGNVDGWLEDKTYLLHTSYTEGLPRAVGEAMSKGLVPIVFRYRGAEKQSPIVWDTISEIVDILNKKHDPVTYRNIIEQERSIPVVAQKVKDLCTELLTETK